MLEPWNLIIIGMAALAAGAVNALAGGGTLITFPVLTALGIPAVAANVTNTVALLPGYFGATLAQLKDIKGQEKRLWIVLPASLIGGLLGGILLLNTGEKLFRQLVPYLILLASLLLAVQEPLRAWVLNRNGKKNSGQPAEGWASIPLGLAAVYGGYFGAGLSVIVLAALGITIEDNLIRLNALKQLVAFTVNIAAAIFFIFSGPIVWSVVLIMSLSAMLGGWLGGKLAGKLKPTTLRWLVVLIGLSVSIYYFTRG